MLRNDGIKTTFLAMNAPRLATTPGTARKPAASNLAWSQPSNLLGTLSQKGPGAGEVTSALGFSRNDSRIACLAH
jgi:hypothetical protein